MLYMGDIAEDATIYIPWHSVSKDGASITRATDGEVRVYKDDGTTQSTAGITDTEDFDSLTGVHMIKIDTSADAFYAAGADYSVVLQGATIDGEVVNAVLATFSIENRFTNVQAMAANVLTATAINANAITAGKIASNAITAAKIAADAIGASELATDAAQEIADEIFRMTTATIEAAGGGVPDDRTLYGVVSGLMHKRTRSATQIVLYQSDDSTVLVTIPITEDSTLNPVDEINPP